MLLLIAIGFSVLRLVLGDENTPAAHCSQNNNGMTDEVRQFFVDKHNEYRSLIAKGLATNKVGGFAPKAARMFKVAMENWFSQLAQIGVPQANMLNLNVFYRGVWYHTQLAWQWSSKIGCAIQDCSTFTYAGCEYNPSGNILGSMIYEIGEPCKVDADCKCTGCTCSVDEALCVQPSATPRKPTSDNTLIQDPIPVPVNYKAKWSAKPARKGYGQNRFSIRPIEPNKTIVAEKAVNNWFSQLAQKGVPQENMLNLNVFYRGVWYYTQLAWQWSYQLGCAVVDCNGFTYAGCEYNPSSLVAKGQAKNGTHGGFAPKAARMLKMSVHSWFNELPTHGAPADNILTWGVFNTGIGHYTALAWQNTHRVGCGVVYCKGWVITGCEYNPPGDVIGSIIYEMGDPCVTDADCNCTGCKCSQEEALCIPPSS
ncbi:hypothetical protein TELCIR_04198 [Teladorsagia circumcincta]|uniref:SCP domain-containing protein n=1 Tax=Teladorsagia circumcincta TaxID=45464 RepID=A0A2G9UUH1_TELCI|nr:hypothetical protein TELCIR_04198 [Teladorsagia circumcincta]